MNTNEKDESEEKIQKIIDIELEAAKDAFLSVFSSNLMLWITCILLALSILCEVK